MSSSAADAAGQRGVADRLGIRPGDVVQQLGDDDDIDEALVTAVVERAGGELAPYDTDDVVDVVLLWFRDDDGDLVDGLVDARRQLGDQGAIWLLTPKVGRDGHVEPSDILEAVPTAGLAQTSTISAGSDWTGSKLVAPKGRSKTR